MASSVDDSFTGWLDTAVTSAANSPPDNRTLEVELVNCNDTVTAFYILPTVKIHDSLVHVQSTF